jgi:hypothetical protein
VRTDPSVYMAWSGSNRSVRGMEKSCGSDGVGKAAGGARGRFFQNRVGRGGGGAALNALGVRCREGRSIGFGRRGSRTVTGTGVRMEAVKRAVKDEMNPLRSRPYSLRPASLATRRICTGHLVVEGPEDEELRKAVGGRKEKDFAGIVHMGLTSGCWKYEEKRW